MATEETPMEFIVWLKPASLAKLSPWIKSQNSIVVRVESHQRRSDFPFKRVKTF